MQVLNKKGGVFDAEDETLATALAAQCAVALQRVRMTEALIEGEKMRQELETAREVQMSTLPATMPVVAGYDVFGTFRPAELTGGDTFDLVLLDQGLLVVLADATGHGIAPALSVTQMHAMLRMAFRLGADLETAFMHVNNQLAETLADDRFITAFIGLLDPQSHRLRFHSGGQGPILHFQAATQHLCDPQAHELSAGRMPLVVDATGGHDRHAAGRHPAAAVGRDLRVLQCGRRGIRRWSASRHLARTHHRQARRRAVGDPVRRGAILRGRLAPGGRHDGGAGEARCAGGERTGHSGATSTRSARCSRSPRRCSRGEQLDAAQLPSVDLVVEELFTNMVKYARREATRGQDRHDRARRGRRGDADRL